MANIETGANTSGLANVDSNYNLMTTHPQVNQRYGESVAASPNNVGAVRMFTENDAGVLSGTAILASPRTSQDDCLQVGMNTPIIDYTFNGTAQDTANWLFTATTMTASQSGGFLMLNASNIGTTTTGCYMATKRYIPLTSNGGLRVSFSMNITQIIAANQVMAMGLGVPASATAVPTDGVYFQYTSAGLIGVVAYNGSVTQTGALPVANPVTLTQNVTRQLQIRIYDRIVHFVFDGNNLGSIATPAGQGNPFITDALPLFVQQYNSGTVSGGTFAQLKVASVAVDQFDSQLVKPYSHQQAAKGFHAYQGQQGGTMGSTALYTNSLAAGAGAAMTNTTAALGTGLGGQFSWQPTLTAGTDGILCSYQNPAGSVTQTPRTLYITGVRIQSFVTTAFTGGPVNAAYSLAFGHTSVSMATAESATFASGTAKAPRRIALGLETFVVTAAVGAVSGTNNPVYMPFNSPVVVNPGEFIAICAKNLGTVTSAGVITSFVTFDGYYE